MQKPKGADRLSQYNAKTADDEVRKVSSERCCLKHCSQTFLQALTQTVRQIFYLKSFDEKREYGIAAGGQMHSVHGTDWNNSGHGYYCCYRERKRRSDAPPNARNRSWKSGHFEISSYRQQLEASDG